MRPRVLVVGFGLLLLGGCDTLGPFAAKFVPIMERMNEEWEPIDMDCDSTYPSRRPKSCISKTLKCGSEIEGNTKVGRTKWGDEFYVAATCMSMHRQYDAAPEVAYKITLPERTTAKAKLVSDCVDLDVFAMRWNDKDLECPGPQHARRVGECQVDATPRGGSVTMTSVNKPETYIIVIDGKKAAEGNYRLKIECSES